MFTETKKQVEKLDLLLTNSFNNVKWDIREVKKQINEIKNQLVEFNIGALKDLVEKQDKLIAAQKVSINELNKKLIDVKKESATKKTYDNKMSSMKDVMKKQNSLVRDQQKAIRVMTRKLEKLEKEKAKAAKAKAAKKAVKKTVKKTTKKKAEPKPVKVKISKVQFASKKKGDLKGEWVELKGRQDMTGWKIKDQGGKHVYKFPKGFKLDGTARLYTGEGKDTKNRLYWNKKNAVWNNDNDTARVFNNKGKVVAKVKSQTTHTFEKKR